MPGEPSALVAIVIAGWLYWRGLGRLWAHADASHGLLKQRALLFSAGLALLIVALVSPLDRLSASLFSAHMVQHLLLILVAGPLLVLGGPLAAWAWALPIAARRTLARWVRTVRWLAYPVVAFGLHSLTLWLWHVPTLYDSAVSVRGIHILEHTSFLLTSALFWWSVLHAGRKAYGAGVLYVFALALQSTVLGAVLTFSPRAWYAAHVSTAPAYGLSPLEDQQLAGLIMWVPGGVAYLTAALVLFNAWMKASAHRPDPEANIPVRQ